LRPAAFFWAVVPPWLVVLRRFPEPDAFPPRLEAPGEFAMRAARDFDIPFSLSASYCFSFLTLGRLSGTSLTSYARRARSHPFPRTVDVHALANVRLAFG
jgi:hypothetical protein